ncbi:hypothetical protein C1645_738548 [Glomus cerebriforme]|uniref:Uncharacterized protein n=1 Tax=Glomus cerebriforme TaxID=658196 RepID=A0A397SV35_9GLOM|nr:hypothetical protein C1645_738548 [Glomus cerebriforme]
MILLLHSLVLNGKIYKFFEKIGIKYITTYSANAIAELSVSQLQTIIDYFSKNPNTELPDDQEGSISDSEEEISEDQTDASEAQANSLVSAEVNFPTTPIPLTHVSNSSNDYSHDNDSEEERLDESDDNGYNGYNGYDEYDERDRGYYYRDGRRERKTSPMMSPIISPVSA